MVAGFKDQRGVRILCERSSDRLARPATVISSCFAGDCSRVGSLAQNAGYDIERRDLKKRFRGFVSQWKYKTFPLLDLVSLEEKERLTQSARRWNKRHSQGEESATREFRIRIHYEKTSDEAVMFGCTVRRWVITRRDERYAANDETGTKTSIEAWYFDHDEFGRVYPPFSRQLIREAIAYATTDGARAVVEWVGDRPSGLCAESTSTTVSRIVSTGGVHERSFVQTSRITSITEEIFPGSMFEPPEGFSRMPLYPSRYTMAMSETMTRVKGWRDRIRQSVSRFKQ